MYVIKKLSIHVLLPPLLLPSFKKLYHFHGVYIYCNYTFTYTLTFVTYLL